MRQKRQLSYFLLKLEEYLSNYHPYKLQDKAFTNARADEALTVYLEAVEQGYDHLQAEELASETLYRELHFSAYDTIRMVLEKEFETELPEPLPEKLTPILLGSQAIREVLQKYDLNDEFDGTPEYELLYTELTGTIALLIEKNKLPTVEM
ncbi:DUF1896 family protein [Porphyromonas levii]|uniref:DUF1896 family protein n=1 Tax=Porphyromonas levii TaxID=28114 RepID=A0A4Y8WMF7_9PORP|nr:DUF1896 family protein [Porphyromonas levii]TFH93971.1 DUF1896 family protein [Porphyromonas levii]TFH94842.1 DUF1896 family protein [Porphyromonas levii]